MALQLITLSKVKQPLKNEVGVSSYSLNNLRHFSENLFRMVRKTPELVSMLDTVVTDHFGGPVDFYTPTGKSLGPTKLKQIQAFWEDQNVQGEAFYGQGIDFFTDGSSFGWHANVNGILTLKQKEAIVKLKTFSPLQGRELEESSNMPREISYLAASTVEIKNNEFGEIYYIQNTFGKEVRWELDQVVHVKLMEWNGEVRGFSALKALTKEIAMMYLLKDNILAKLENGGSPDHIISVKGGNGFSKARFERLRIALESFSHLKKSHGNMPIDAEVNAIPLGVGLKDMEYRELAMFIISEFALGLGMPTSRVPFLMTGSGGSSNKGELSGNSEDSYQTKINSRRMKFENGWNKVFRKAGFIFKFRRDNLQDDVRETQSSVQRAAYVAAIQTSLFKAGKKLVLPAQLALLSGSKKNVLEEDVEDLSDEEKMVTQPNQSPVAGPGGSMQPGKFENASKLTKDLSMSKQRTAFNNEKFR